MKDSFKLGSRHSECGHHWLPEKGRDESLEVEVSDNRVEVNVGVQWESYSILMTTEEARQMAMWILSKTGGIDEPAPHGAKLCPVCCDHRLVNFRTAKHEAFDKPGYRHCSGCGTDIPWHLDEGQPPLLGSNRATSKTEKGNG